MNTGAIPFKIELYGRAERSYNQQMEKSKQLLSSHKKIECECSDPALRSSEKPVYPQRYSYITCPYVKTKPFRFFPFLKPGQSERIGFEISFVDIHSPKWKLTFQHPRPTTDIDLPHVISLGICLDERSRSYLLCERTILRLRNMPC
jgi:hypothetical protein